MSAFEFLAAPARRALASAGIESFDDLGRHRAADVLALHGMGKNAMARLEAEMARRGWSFADESGG